MLISYTAAQSGFEIATMVDKREVPSDIISKTTMLLTNSKDKTRTSTILSKSLDNGSKQILWFLAPVDDKGVAFLKIEHDNNYKFEFLFDRSKDMDNPKVYRRINGKFIEIGNLLAEKQGAYVIWEDKDFFKTTDFAWTFDKVTSKLSSIVLSVGLGIEKLDKIPKPMTCMQKIFYY